MAKNIPPVAPTPPVPPADDPPGTVAVIDDIPEPTLDIEQEMRDSFLTYAMSVIVSRALPDVRDGLKPSQRRILVAMHDLGLSPSGTTSKCAAIVGETMKRYHPHGDASIYDTLVRLAQDWVVRYKLVQGQGNFGSIAGLPAAAHRYTEAKLTPLSSEMLDDLNSETVDFIDNYDGKYREPLVLPCKVPNLLVNGSDGIAVGMVTEIPPHNLKEVCNGLIALIDNPDLSLGELIQHVPGPDFPTGGEIRGRQGIIDGYRTGRGKITLRARVDIPENGKQLIITEVPFQTTRNKLAEVIGQLVRDERIKEISALRDESAARNGEPVRLVVELKRGADPQLVLNQLYQYSPLQKTVSIILLALVDGRPRVLTLKEMMQEFLKHRVQVIRRRTEFKLSEARRRAHVLEGQLIAISALDEVIRICRASPDRNEAKAELVRMEVTVGLMTAAIGAEAVAALQRDLGIADIYRMTDQQAEAVVRLQLGQLAALESAAITGEYNELRGQIRGYEALLGSEENVSAVIRSDLTQLRDRFGDARKTDISDEGGMVDLEDLIPETDQAIVLTSNGYLKRLPRDTFRSQRRGGRGVAGGGREDSQIEHFLIASTHAWLLCFTNMGQLYWIKVYTIPEGSRTSGGRSIANVLQLRPDEKITSMVPVRHLDDERFELLMATRAGIIKKTTLLDYKRVKQGGIIGIHLDEGDTLLQVCCVELGDEILLSTKNGMAIRFGETDARSTGRNTRGVRGIMLTGGDQLVGMVVADPDGEMLTICEKGYGKRTPFGPNSVGETDDSAEEVAVSSDDPENPESPSSMRYRKQRRGGKGVRDIRTSARNGKVIGIAAVREDQDVMMISQQGMVTRLPVREIRRVGRNTQGVRLMNLHDNDTVVSFAIVPHEEPEIEATEVIPAIAPPAEPLP